MQVISSPINPKDTGNEVNNLQTALLLFLDKQIIATFQPPDSPTEEEITKLREVLKDEKASSFFGDATRKLVSYFQLQQGLSDKYNGAVEETTAARMNDILYALGALDDTENIFFVKGFIRNPDGTGFSNGVVKAVDRDLRRLEPLGETTSDKDGYYEITYTPQQSNHGEKWTADLQVLVYEAVNDDEKKPLLISDIFFNATPVQEINLTLPVAPADKEKSEWQRMNEDVLLLLKGQKQNFQSLTVYEDLPPEELNPDDVDFIARETGLDKSNLQLWSLAYGRSKEVSSIAAEIFYSWFRMGLPTELKGLWERTTEELNQKLKEAVSKNIIAELSDDLIKSLDAIDQVRIAFHLSPAKEGEKVSIGDILNTLPIKLDPIKQIVVAKFLLAPLNDDPILDKLKENGFEDYEIFGVQRTLGLQNLTQSHLPLIEALQVKKPIEAEASLIDLVKLEPSDWLALVKEHGFPGTVKGDDAEQNQQLYADQLAHTIEQKLPSAWVTERIKDNRFPVDLIVKDDAAKFFEQNPGFQIGKTQVLNYFSNKEQVVLNNIKDPENVKKELLKIERIVSCSPRLALTAKIINKGFHSSFSIMQRSKESFVSEMMDGSPAMEAQLISTYVAAQERHAKATVLVTEYIRAKKDSPIAILKHKPETSSPTVAVGSVSSAATAATDVTADLETLFGNLDFCDCEHCSSVYSPAAYMVDLLQMLDSGQKTKNLSPLDVLLARRPDIGEIDLTCDNTNTSVPYIDLALEILENAVITFTISNLPSGISVVGQNKISDSLDNNIIPDRLKNELASRHLITDQEIQLTIQQPSKRWVIRQQGIKITLQTWEVLGSLMIIPCQQTVSTTAEITAVPQFVNPLPYDNQLLNTFYPWSLPFDLWREETNAWLKQLGIDRNQLMNLVSNVEQLNDVHIASEFLGFSNAEVDKLTNTTIEGWQEWGFEGQTVTSVKDPIAGEQLNFAAPNYSWIEVLNKHASILRHRAKLSQRELMNLIEMRFIQLMDITPGRKIELTGDECNATKMELTGLDESSLKRIHIFVRLWRKLGWSMFDLDRTIAAFPQASNNNRFTPEFIVFVANIERLRQQTGLPIGLILNWYAPNLDTYSYNDFSSGPGKAVLSPYESLFYDRSVSRPRDAAFELRGDRKELVLSPIEIINSKLSLVAAALSVKQTELKTLLVNTSFNSIALTAIKARTIGKPVNCTNYKNPFFELNLFELYGSSTSFTIQLEHAVTGSSNFSAIPPDELYPLFQPLVITTLDAPQVLRFLYKGKNPFLRITVTPTRPVGAKLRMSGTILFDPLTLGQLSRLTRFTTLSKVLSLSTADLLLAINLTGIDPFISPESTLDLFDKLQLIRSAGFSLYDLDYLLRHQSLQQASIAISQEKAASVLSEIRQGIQKNIEETAQQIDERGEITKKWLSNLQWNGKMVDELLGPAFLGGKRIEANYFANHLPAGISLTASMNYDRENQQLSITVPANGLSIALAELNSISTTDMDLQAALGRLKSQVETSASISVVGTNYIGHDLPQDIAISDNDVIAYDATNKKIYATKILTESNLSILKNRTTDVDFNEAIDSFISQLLSTDAIAAGIRGRMMNFNPPEYAVRFIPTQPLIIPSAWSGRFFYRADDSTLVFAGLMNEAEKAALKALYATDSEYTNAIEILHDNSNPPVTDPASTTEFISLSFAKKLIYELHTPGERYAAILSKLLPFIKDQLNFTFLVEKLSTAFAWDPALTTRLLKQVKLSFAASPELVAEIFVEAGFSSSDKKVAITPAGFDKQFKALELLYKNGLVASRLKIKPNQTDWIYDSIWLGLPDLNLLPLSPVNSTSFQQWTNLVQLMQLRDNWPGGEAALHQLHNLVKGSLLTQTSTPLADVFLIEIAKILKWPLADFKLLIGGTGLNFISNSMDDFRKPEKLTRLAGCLNLMLRIGATSEMVIAWKQPSPSAKAGLQARQLVRSRYEQSTWYELAQPVQNNLRQLRRSALLDYLITLEGVRDANDLYGKYLIDPEMGPCMMTTRILQAINSIQLFIHRCLMGLENDVPASSIHKDRWQWMKNYRVWEANRKVFFYPENWIEPELRDDKSPFFKELESELLQGDVTGEKAEKALGNYLNKLDEVARLEVVGMYRETSYDLKNEIEYGFETLHIFGRTYSEPRTYYYRKYIKLGFAPTDGYWTSWEKVELDIEEGNYLYPVVWKQKLHLFWLTFIEKADDSTLPQPGTLPNKYWSISLAWSNYENGNWQASKKYPIDKIGMKLKDKKYNFSLIEMGNNDLIKFKFTAIFETQGGVQVETTNLTQIKYDGYGIDIINDPSFDNTYLNAILTPSIKWYGSSKMLVSTQASIPVFDSKKLIGSNFPMRLFYSFQDLDVGFKFSAPSILNHNLHNISVGKSDNHPLSFFITNPSRESFFGYPYESLIATNKEGFKVSEKIYFTTFYHPQTKAFQDVFCKNSLKGLLDLSNQSNAIEWAAFINLGLNKTLVPTWQGQDVDFSSYGAYSQYNWELFFHLPFIVAIHLAKNQRFEEARQWFHYIFDPTDNSSGGSEPSRFWHFRPFNENADTTPIQKLALMLANPGDHSNDKNNFDLQVNRWLANPFKPHAVARWRNRAYMFSVVMKYLDNLIAWGDQLFRRDTRESLNEATQIYILAAQILGRKPESVPNRTKPKTQSFSDIRDNLDSLSNAQVAAENAGSITAGNVAGGTNSNQAIFTLLFCVPDNPKILEYYDKVADRLFKLRNCMNIDGVVNPLPLFDPPIDPAILVKAAAAGVDLSTALSDINAPLPLYRFSVMSQKATELCGEVKSLGSALLSALEKRDGEALSLLRSTHEMELLKQQRQIKELQVEEAKANIEALAKSYESTQTKFMYYLGLVSMVDTLTVPSGQAGQQAINLINAALDTVGKTVVVLGAVASVVNPAALAGALLMNEALTKATGALSTFLPAQEGDTNKIAMIPAEKRYLDELKQSHDLQQKAKDYQSVAQMMAMLPDITLGIQGVTSSPVIQAQVGGTLLSKIAQLQGAAIEYESSEHVHRANLHSILAGYQRRAEEWLHQATLAKNEAEQILKQSTAAALRLTIAGNDLLNHDKQIKNTETTDDYMRSKFTNQELYDWMASRISETYFQSYQLAYDVSKRAEKAYRFELGLQDNESNFIQFGYWDSLKKGLLAGENLFHDIKRMEVGYLEKNKREYELTKHVSLVMIDSLALVRLRTTGICDFEIPEVLFDIDHPGHYFRRIKSVSISVPCIAGPYTSVSARLSLVNSRYRKNTNADNAAHTGYKEEANPVSDSRFVFSIGSIQSIATSNAQNDSGVFELNFKDERYLPFEGAGAISSWQLELPSQVKQFDYNTISDVIIHIKYTAREGGAGLKQLANNSIAEQLKVVSQQFNQTGLHVPISLKHDMPNELNLLKKNFTTEIKINMDRLPYLAKSLAIQTVDLFLIARKDINFLKKADGTEVSFSKLPGVELYKAAFESSISINTNGSTTVRLSIEQPVAGQVRKLNEQEANSLDELVLLIRYSGIFTQS